MADNNTNKRRRTWKAQWKLEKLTLKKTTLLVYALQAFGIVLGVTFIAGVIINYLKKDLAKGTIYESHFRWQLRSFWFGTPWIVIGVFTSLFLVGYFILIANSIWMKYRIVKGWMALNDGKEMYAYI